MRRPILLVAITLCGITTTAQGDAWQRIIEQKVPRELRMSAGLYQLGAYAQVDRDAALAMARSWGHLVRDDGRLYIELVAVNAPALDPAPAQRAGIEINNVWRKYASAWVPIDGLLDMAGSLSDRYRFQGANNFEPANEGPQRMNSTTYVAAGADGSGLKIAIIDSGFDSLLTAQQQGAAPTALVQFDHVGTGIQAGGVHGTGCLETVFDHAPGAAYQIHRVSGGADFGAAVDQCIADGVDIISLSLGYYNTGWFDDEGSVCESFNEAANAGILCFVAAGNQADGQHYQGAWSDPNGNNWLNWEGGSENNTVTVGAGGSTNYRLSWATPLEPFSGDYDLFLYDNNNNVLASSQSNDGFENISWTNQDPNNAITVHVRVKNAGEGTHDLEIFSHNGPQMSVWTAASSTASPMNCTAANILSIGAVPFLGYQSPPGSVGIQAAYSSQGPTNSGNQAPDLCAPTNTTTVAYGGGFSGTSCAAPHAAGAAAALWSALPGYSASGIRMVLLKLAALHKDWGAAGTDMIFGHGGVFLNDHRPNMEFILPNSGNSNGSSQIPYATMQQADQYAPAGSNILFLGGTYAEPPAGTILDTPAIYRSVQEPAVVQ
ncbi:MAG: S8 family serine peptidase [Flavobacteriales bacterium]|jgi:hypothetical protein|nr:S8 family serine peptidase [Flavobacteriales bacterium]